MKIDWSYYLFTQVVGVAITLLFFVMDPEHRWEPRAFAISLQLLVGFIFCIRTNEKA